MKRIIGYNGKTLEELNILFHCKKCGCDFEAEYGDYTEGATSTKTWSTYCTKCNRQVFAVAEECFNEKCANL